MVESGQGRFFQCVSASTVVVSLFVVVYRYCQGRFCACEIKFFLSMVDCENWGKLDRCMECLSIEGKELD